MKNIIIWRGKNKSDLIIGHIEDDGTPSIPFFKKYDNDYIVTINGCVYDEYTRLYHFLIEAGHEGDDSDYYMFNSTVTEVAICPLDMRVIPSEFFISELENIFEDTHGYYECESED